MARKRDFRFEHKSEPLLSEPAFRSRMLRVGTTAFGIVVVALTIGACGYHVTEDWGWLDATLNAAMILTGMGPVDPIRSDAGKLFAIVYALFSGMVFLSAIALALAPIGHRILHAFHLEDEGTEKAPRDPPGRQSPS